MNTNLDNYKGKSFYKVYHIPTAQEFYFSSKPGKNQLKKLDLGVEVDNWDDFDVILVKFVE